MTCRSYRDELAMICLASPNELSFQFTCIPVMSGVYSVMDAYCEHIIYISMLDKGSLAMGAQDECTTIILRQQNDEDVHICHVGRIILANDLRQSPNQCHI